MGTITLTSPVAATEITAGLHATNYAALQTLLNGNLDNANISTSAVLDATARVGVRKNSAGSTFSRRRINLIEGTNITLTVADDSGSEEVDVTIASTAAVVIRKGLSANVTIANGAGSGSLAVAHGLGAVPTAVVITPAQEMQGTTSSGGTRQVVNYWVSTLDGTNFTINIQYATPGSGSNGAFSFTFYWVAI